jgi:hypothetical protein
MAPTADRTALEMIAAFDHFLAGGDGNHILALEVAAESMFGAMAYELALDRDQAATAMCRAFLIALVDPAHPDLDYLRAALPPRVQQ